MCRWLWVALTVTFSSTASVLASPALAASDFPCKFARSFAYAPSAEIIRETQLGLLIKLIKSIAERKSGVSVKSTMRVKGGLLLSNSSQDSLRHQFKKSNVRIVSDVRFQNSMVTFAQVLLFFPAKSGFQTLVIVNRKAKLESGYELGESRPAVPGRIEKYLQEDGIYLVDTSKKTVTRGTSTWTENKLVAVYDCQTVPERIFVRTNTPAFTNPNLNSGLRTVLKKRARFLAFKEKTGWYRIILPKVDPKTESLVSVWILRSSAQTVSNPVLLPLDMVSLSEKRPSMRIHPISIRDLGPRFVQAMKGLLTGKRVLVLSIQNIDQRETNFTRYISEILIDALSKEKTIRPAFPIWIISFVGPNAVFSCKIKVLASPCHHLARGPNG